MAVKQKSQNEDRGVNQGALFANDKGGNDKRPDVTGKLILKVEDYTPNDDGTVTVLLAGWTRESDKVGSYTSLKAQPPQAK